MITDILGIIGVVIINISYFLLSSGKMTADNKLYPLSNLIGAGLIICSLLDKWNLSAFLMESSWVAISFYGLLNSLKKKRQTTIFSAK